MFRRNIKYKLLALSIAIVVWAYANGGIKPHVTKLMKVNAEFTGVPPVGYRFNTPQFIPSRAKVNGTAGNVNKVDRLVVVVDYTEVDAGGIDSYFPVQALNKKGRFIQDVELAPDRVRLRIGLRRAPARRIVLVSPNIVGHPQYPYTVSDIELNPENVAITGRPEQLLGISTLKTEPIDLTGRTETFSQRTKIIAPSGLTLPDVRYAEIRVKIQQVLPVQENTQEAPNAASQNN